VATFHGSVEQLKDQLLLAGLDGEWLERGNGVWQLKGADGANCDWSSTKGTIWCDGKAASKAAFEGQIAVALDTSFDAKAAVLPRATSTAARKVFVAYGHDGVTRTSLEAMLRRWGFEPLILDQLTSGGQTIIEKLESVRNEVNFAIDT
jgi:predicted nucleotide-binding protein